MNVGLSEEQRALVETVREFAERVLAPGAAQRDADETLPMELLEQAGELGLGGIYAREELGGSGLSRHDGVLIFEELARGDVPVAAFITVHNMVVWMIDTYGSDELRRAWVERLAPMREYAAYALTEPGAGSDAAALATTAVRDGDEWVLNGTKQFITGAGMAAVYIVMARTGGPGARGISAFVVPAETPGLSFGPREKKMGWRAQPTRQVILDGVRVPAGNLLGEEGTGFRMARRALNGGRLNIAACALGGAEWAFDRAVRYVQEREAFGAPLAAIDTVVFQIADMRVKLAASRALLHDAARALDAGAKDAPAQCAMAKRFTTDSAFEVANQALQLHGGYGYLADYGLERTVRDLRVHQILEGTNEIMAMIVGRGVLDAAR